MFGSFKVNIPSLDVNIKGPSIPSKVGINVSGPSIGGGAGIHAHGVGPTLNVHGQGPHMGGGVGLNVHPPQVAPVNINVHGPSIAPVVNDFQYIIPESAHPHPLIIEEHLNGICKLCKVNIGGLAGYRCGACDILLCFNCACRIFFGNKQVNCHPQHPLALTSRNTGWKCDICKNHFKGGASFYCRMCDFDACDLCYLAEGYPVGFVIPEPTIMLHPPVRPPMHPPHEPSVGYSSQPSGGPILPPQPAFPSPQDNETIMRLNETIKSYELKIKDLENGEKYEGNFKNGLRDGNGKYFYKNGDVYDGEFKDGKIEGEGVMTYENGHKYEGEFRDNLRDGKGTYYYKNGDRYEGSWRKGLKEGKGVYYWKAGDRFEGYFENNEKGSYGKYFYQNGERYEGELKNGVREGKGVYYWPDGDRYEGDFKNGKREGQGVYYWSDGDRAMGNYANDKEVGLHVRLDPVGHVIETYYEQ